MAVETRRLYQQIADEVRALIASGEFTAGSRLPAERELAQRLGVSRPSLREALIALEIDGRVEVRMGSGVYVMIAADRDTDPTRGLGESAADLMQARAMLEGAVAGLASRTLTARGLEQLGRVVADMADEIAAGQTPLRSDRAFHIEIAAATGNGALVSLVGQLFDQRHDPIIRRVQARMETSDTWAAALAEHRSILVALAAGDPWQAQAAMATHLYRARGRWLDEEEQAVVPPRPPW